MSVRVFGPTLGAGVRIEEQQGAPSITPAPFGTTAYVGILAMGPVGELIETVSKEDAIRRTGGYVEGEDTPDALRHFYENSQGAGQVFLSRVTAGNEIVSSVTLYSRQAPERTAVVRVDAENGGRWAGRRRLLVGDITGTTDLTETTLDTLFVGSELETDELAGGTLFMSELPSVSFEVTGNTSSTPGPAIITIASDSTLKTQYDASGGGDLEYAVEMANVDDFGDEKHLAVQIVDGTIAPDTEWGLKVFLDDVLVREWPDLDSDPNGARYFIDVINNDTSNFWITVTDLFTGAITAAVRPANHYGQIPTIGVTTTVLTIEAATSIAVNSPTGADGTADTFTPGTDARSETITCTLTAVGPAAAFDVDSDMQERTMSPGVTATPYVADNKYTTGFTITDGTGIWAIGDTITIKFEYLVVDECVGGFVYPDVDNAPTVRFRIESNTISTVTVPVGNDLTADGADGDNYRIEYPQQLEGGYDGTADLVDSDFTGAWDTGSSLFNRLAERNLGLVKYGTPGRTTTAIQQAGVAYANANNGQYRIELPAATTTEAAAVAFMQNTVGRSDYEAVVLPSFIDVVNTGGRSGLKRVSATGAIHGREARTAADFGGYHKAAAGKDHVLSQVKELPTGKTILNEEVLNPNGIAVIKKKAGNFILWGDRLPFINPSFRFKHTREQLSHYERILSEEFDFIVFAINDALTRPIIISALQSFFLPEFTKRALRGDSFEEAATIKVDAENNPESVVDAGEAVADIDLNLAATIEKMRIRISKQGIFEESGA